MKNFFKKAVSKLRKLWEILCWLIVYLLNDEQDDIESPAEKDDSGYIHPLDTTPNLHRRRGTASINSYSTDPVHNIRNGSSMRWDRRAFTLLQHPTKKKSIYFSLGICCLLLVARFWWNINYENLVIRDQQNRVILNCFGSSASDQLYFSENNLENHLKEMPPLTRLELGTDHFERGYFSAYFTDHEAIKNVTFAKVQSDVAQIIRSQEDAEGCFCANELGLSLDAIFSWKTIIHQPPNEKPVQKREILAMYSPNISFNTDEHYKGKYELGVFICAKRITVDFLFENGQEGIERFQEFLAVCACSCQDFIEKMISEKQVELRH